MDTEMKKRKFFILAGIIVAAILICLFIALIGLLSGEGEAEEEEPVAVAVEENEEEEIEEEVELPKSLLTGEEMDEELAGKRPIALMMENTSACQPLYGIRKAGIIYECPVEGGITRLMGIFEDYRNLPRFGNVRSCRPYFAYIAAEYDAIYVHFGQSTEGKEVLSTGIVDNLNGIDMDMESLVFYRAEDRSAPHNAYTSTEGIEKGIEKKGYRDTYAGEGESHFLFREEKETRLKKYGKKAKEIHMYYLENHPYFIYDKESGEYLRFEYGDKEIDGADDEQQISVKNIIFQNVPSTPYADGLKLNIPLTGSVFI